MKYHITNPRRFWQIMLTLSLMLIFVFFAFRDQQAPVKLPEATVTITADTPTFWDLATCYAPQSMDKRDWIYQVRQLNSTPAGQLQIGQTVRILEPIQ